MPSTFQSSFESNIPGYASGGYTCPPASFPEVTRIAWLQRSVGTGLEWLRSQSAGVGYEQTIALIANRVSDSLPRKLSRVQIRRLKRDLREIISTLTNLNPRSSYSASPEDLQDQVRIFNKRSEYWWQTSFIDRSLKKALQHAVAGGGYISLVWGKNPYGSNQNDVIPKVFGTFDFIPDQIPNDGDLQKAYAGHLLDTTPFNLACATFPHSAPYLTPDRTMRSSESGGGKRMLSRWAGTLMGALGLGGLSSTMEPLNSFPELDIYYSYIADDSINESGMEMHVNELINGTETSMLDATGTTWEYKIPTLGQPIPTGVFEYSPNDPNADENGMIPLTRPATREDCKLYPLRRLIIWTSHMIIYDGPSFWWHGQIPVVKFTLDQWPFEYLGYNLVTESLTIEQAINSLSRGFVDCLELKMDPPTRYKDKEHSRKMMEQVNLRIPGTKIPSSGLIPNSIESVFPYQHYEPSQQTMPMLQNLKADLDYQLGVQDLTAVAKLQQVPSAETVDKLLQAAGPLVQDYAREMEKSLTEIGMMFMWLVLQFDSERRRLEILGADGITKEDFDFDPGKLSPANVPGELPGAPIMRRGLAHGRRFAYSIVPRSVFRVTDVQNKLFYFQLWRDGRFPLDPWTLADIWNIPNFGTPPAVTVIDRFEKWQEMEAKRMALLQVEVQMLSQKALIMGQLKMAMEGFPAQLGTGAPGEGSGAPSSGEGQGPPGEKNREGRPPSGNEPPSLQTKGDGRSTISESG